MMAEPPDRMPATAGRGHLRASHADREQVIGTLKAAFVQGRLAKDEFDLRVGQTFAARTCAELAAVTGDLPARLVATQVPKPVLVPPPPPAVTDIKKAARIIATATAIYADMWLLAFFLPTNSEGEPQAAFALVWASTLIWLLFLLLIGAEMFYARQEKRSSGQLPPQPASSAGGQAAVRPFRRRMT
jgi:hypothetical protein